MNDTAGIQLLENASWLDANWMWISGALGLINALFLFTYIYQTRYFERKWCVALNQQHWYGFLLCTVYSLHQLEEHGYDIYGRRYMFVPIFNVMTKKALGITVSVTATTYINLITIWFSFPVCTFLSTSKNMYLPAAISWGTAIVNGFTGHLLPVLNGEYVPGALQSVFMVPLGFYALIRIYGGNGCVVGLILPLVGGVIFHLVALIAPVKFFPESAEDYMVPLFLILGGVVIPLVLTFLTKKIVQLYSSIYVMVNS